MISKCKAWLRVRLDLKKRLQFEINKSRHYAMLYENALEETFHMSNRMSGLRAQIQLLESHLNSALSPPPKEVPIPELNVLTHSRRRFWP